MGAGSSRAREGGLGAAWLLAALSLGAGCGVWGGNPIELFSAPASDGGVLSEDPCIETVQAVSGANATVIGASAFELVQLVDGDHNGNFVWVSGDKTRVTVSVEDPHVFSVVSRTNRYVAEPYSQRHCANYARVEATVRVRTVDGRLDESIGKLNMMAFSGDEVRGSLTIPSAELHGTYTPSLRREHCYASSTLQFLIATDGTHGSLSDALGSGVCQADGGTLGTAPFAGGHWGARWQNY